MSCWRRLPDGARFLLAAEGRTDPQHAEADRGDFRGLQEAPAGRCGAGGAGGRADRRRPRHRGGTAGDRQLPPLALWHGGDRRGDQAGAGRGDSGDPGAGGAAAAARSGEEAACRAGGRRERHRQDHDHRQDGAELSRAGQAAGAGGRRHVPRGGGGAVADLGRARRRAGDRRRARCRCRRAGVRCADAGDRRRAPTCC